ncbi:MAG TPA: ABC transporter permease [Puia sp.]|uniref:ABC transporter permease n=1 Tax=Puia sp. TaxID=2045100 RepID=UPI002CD70BA0|nr:ABC transporter permease [Puia sp.]HVU95401.1 ABC transporter permease [Puia sp.]
MLFNHLLTAWRRLRKNKGFFALNFMGLYLSVTAALLIALLILFETSFDRGGATGGKVYRVVAENSTDKGADFTGVTPYPMAKALRALLPQGARVTQLDYERDMTIVVGDQALKETQVIFADSVFPQVFPLTVKDGSLTRAFKEPGFCALTETTAKRYFGSEPAVGKRLKTNNGKLELEVAAVVADAPANSHLPYHLLISYPSFSKDFIGGFNLDTWTMNASGFTYVALPTAANVAPTEHVLAGLVEEHLKSEESRNKTRYFLQPVSTVHYDTRFAHSNPAYTISTKYLYLVGAIGLFLILAASINYTNLSTALAIRQSKEVGIRKTLGATRQQLVRQLLTEAFVLTGGAILAAALSVRLFLPLMNSFLDRQIPLNWLTPASGGFLLALWVIVSLLAGFYPAIVLSGFRPVTALKSKVFTPGASVLNLRRGLVVFQFVTAQVLIICAVVVARQMAYVRNAPMGFDKDLVVDIGLPTNKAEDMKSFRSRLGDIPAVEKVSFSIAGPVSQNRASTSFNLRERYKAKQFEVEVKAGDEYYLDTYGLKLVAGRWFDGADEKAAEEKGPDSVKKYAFVLNETAVKTLGFRRPEDAIGRYVTFGFNDISAPVVGVVKDYHVASMHDAIMPVLMVPFPFLYYNVGVRLRGGFSASAVAGMEKAFQAVYPRELFESHFLDQTIAEQYAEEQRTQGLFQLFTGLSIAINILGLIGLLSFLIEAKTKEVGIRKVLGASMADISILLSRDFLKLMGIAFLVAAPVAGLLMDRWLRDFAYRTGLSGWVFAGGLGITFVVTAVAISFQTVRAALVNPVRSLRSE